MISAPQPENEIARIAALDSYGVLDTDQEPVFDAITRSAALVCGVPIALVSLVDRGRQWFKSSQGLPGVRETSRDIAFCAHAILSPGIFEVPDASDDERFRDNPLVIDDPGIRFYAGAPLIDSEGFSLGTLCVIDRKPGRLSVDQRAALADLAMIVVRLIESKRARETLRVSEQRFRGAFETAAHGIALVSTEGAWLAVNASICRMLGYTEAELLATDFQAITHPDDLESDLANVRAVLAGVIDTYQIEKRYFHKDGRIIWALLTVSLVTRSDGRPHYFVSQVHDITARRQAEELLRHSEERYRMVAENATDIITLYGIGLGAIYISPACERVLGYRPDELMRRTVDDAVHPDDLRLFLDVRRTLETGIGETKAEYRVRHKDGRFIWVEGSFRSIALTGTTPERILTVVRNIDDRKRAEESLRHSEERYRALADNATELITLREPGPEGRLLYVSPAIRTVLGYSPEEFAALPQESLIHPDDFAGLAESGTRLLGGDERVTSIHRLLHRDGSYIWVEVSMSVVLAEDGRSKQFMAVVRDVNTRKIAEENAERLQTLLTEAIDAMQDGVALFDADDRLVLVNRALRDGLTGYPDVYVPGHTYAEIVERYLIAILGDEPAVLEAGMPVAIERHRNADGTPEEFHNKRGLWIIDRQFRTRDGGVLSVTTDISPLKNAALEIAAARDAAEEANRAKSIFLANMSHEIRTPMNAIIGFADLLLDRGLSVEQEQQVSMMRDAGKSLLGIINDILDFSKIEAGKLELEKVPMDLTAVVDGACALIRGEAAAKGLVFRVDRASDLPDWILGDATRLRQVLVNLLNNALKFTKRGSITLGVRRDDDDGKERLLLEVSDTGIGIPAHRQHQLFQNFSQAHQVSLNHYGGTGLGLAISKRLVEAMGGTIGVRSAEGGGSTFWFTIDCLAAGAQTISAVPVSCEVRPMRILVVEDLRVNQIVVETMLVAAGHRVTLAANGAEAIEVLRRGDFDLVLMDVQMPIMDGVTATAAIRSMSDPVRAIPIIALSANAMVEEVERCKAAGMNDHLAKPIDRHLLLSTIANWSGVAPVNSAPRSSSEIAILDDTVLDDLEAHLGKAKLAVLADLCRQEINATIAAVRSDADRERLARQAHAMVSVAGSMGCIELMGRCRDLSAALVRKSNNILLLARAIDAAAHRAIAALNERFPV